MDKLYIGIDAGGTLIKIAYSHGASMQFTHFPTDQIEAAAVWVKEQGPDAEICVTGGKAEILKDMLQSSNKQPVTSIIEFEATCAGARHLLRQRGAKAPDSYVLTNVGTGTSIHVVTLEGQSRVGGTGVGGGTLMGLAHLFAGTRDYAEIVQIAQQGVRSRVDLTVADIYEDAVPPIPGDLTASNFGNVHNHPERKISDILAAVIGLIGETITTVSVHAAAQYGVSTIVYVGSTFAGNALLHDVVVSYSKLRGSEAIVLEHGEYCGAIGAILARTRA